MEQLRNNQEAIVWAKEQKLECREEPDGIYVDYWDEENKETAIFKYSVRKKPPND